MKRGYEKSNKFQIVFNRTVGKVAEPLSSKGSVQRLGLMGVIVAQCVTSLFS
jgi:hypothetical protein